MSTEETEWKLLEKRLKHEKAWKIKQNKHNVYIVLIMAHQYNLMQVENHIKDYIFISIQKTFSYSKN